MEIYYSEFLSKVLEHKCPYQLQVDKIDPESIPKLRMNILVGGLLSEDIQLDTLHNFSPVQEEFTVPICK